MKKHITLYFLIFFVSYIHAQTLTAELKIPETTEANSFFLVEVTVTKSNISGFMKYTQKIPPGYVAIKGETQGGAFTFTDTIVKIIWLSPPEKDMFTFTYKLKIPENDSFKSVFSAKIDYLINRKPQYYVFENKVIALSKNTTPTSPPSPIAKPEPTVLKEADQHQQTPQITPPVVSPEKVKVVSSGKITYAAQIGAYSKKVVLKGVKDVKTIKGENGIIKYVSGNFNTYEEALKYATSLKALGYKDAYVIKFVNGKIADK